jgi:hypothetical protein
VQQANDINLPLLQPSDVVSVEWSIETRVRGAWEVVGARARFNGWPESSCRSGQSLPGPAPAGAIVRFARALVSQMFGATPGMSLSPGFAGIHSGAAAAPIRDFSYNLCKLRKCQHMYLAETADRGLGVFAAREFAPGDVVMMDFDGDYYEQVLSYRELCEKSIDLK